MSRTLLVLLLLAWGSMSGFCQVPGYLGKKLTIQGEFHSFPAINGPTASNKGLQNYDDNGERSFGLNWSAGARLGYVVSRHSQVLVSFDYLKTGMTQTAYFPSGFDFGSRELFYELTGLTFGVGTRKFRSSKGGLAPMGTYSGYSLSATFLKGEVNRKFSSGSTETHGTEAKHLVPSFGYDFGSNFIIKDRVLLNVGAKLNFALSPRALRYIIAEEAGWDPYSNEKGLSFEEGNTENFKSAAASRFALHSVFMIYVGVGLLQ